MAYTFPYNDPGATSADEIISEINVSQSYEISTDQTIASAGDKLLNLTVSGTEDPNFTLVSGNQIKVLSDGRYLFGYSSIFSENSSGVRTAWLAKNGSYASTIVATNTSFKSNVASRTAAKEGGFSKQIITIAPESTPITIEFMYRPSAFGSGAQSDDLNGKIMGWRVNLAVDNVGVDYPTGLNRGVFLYQKSTGILGIVVKTFYSSAEHLEYLEWDANTLVLDTWYHIAIVQNAASFTLYINGVSAGAKTSTTWGSHTGGNIYGWTQDHDTFTIHTSSQPLSFTLDELRISNIARYSSGFTQSTGRFTSDANTVALYHFEDLAEGSGYKSTTTTSNSSVTLGTGSKTFAVSAGLPYASGDYVLMMQTDAQGRRGYGTVTSYSGTELVLNLSAVTYSLAGTAFTFTNSPTFKFTDATSNNHHLRLRADSIVNSSADNFATFDYTTGYPFPADAITDYRFAEGCTLAAPSGFPTIISSSETALLVSGDYVQHYAYQNSNATLNPYTSNKRGRVWIMRAKQS
jgi:hypothetical protein